MRKGEERGDGAARPRSAGGAERPQRLAEPAARGAGARRPADPERAPSARGGRAGRKEAPPRGRPATAEEMLGRALSAPSPRSRALWARRGLALRGALDRTTQAMLLRQLYLAHYEERRFAKAIEVSEQLVTLGVLPDVAHQDAARAKQAAGDIEGALGHLRLAARTGPASRKAFHWWTLGSVCYLARRYDEAIGALTRAARWGTTGKPLYQGHLAVAQCESGLRVPGLGRLIARLSEVPAGQGYGRFVLGQMAFHAERWDEARRHLEAFVRRTTTGRAATAIALDGEVARARETLAALAALPRR